MKVKWVCAAFVSVLIITTFGVTIPANAELHAVVEDSTTLAVLDNDSTEVFRKEYPFVVQISEEGIHICESEDRPTAVLFHYEARDTGMVNPLPKAYTHDAYKDLKRHFWRSHLLVIGKQGEELLSSDMRWHKIFCNGLVFPDENTLFVFYFDTGELIKVDLPTKQRTTIALSDWGCRAFWDEEGPNGMAEAFPGNRVAVVRNTYECAPPDSPSEVALLTANGDILWKHEDPGVRRRQCIVDSQYNLVITVRRYCFGGPTDVSFLPRVHYDLQAIDESGEEVWVVPLGRQVVRRMELSEGKLVLMVRDLGSGMPGEKLPWRRLELNTRTGEEEGES